MDQFVDSREIEIAVAPLQGEDGIEAMTLHLLDQFFVEGRAAAGRPEGAVAHMAARPARDLPHFRRSQTAKRRPSNFRSEAKAM